MEQTKTLPPLVSLEDFWRIMVRCGQSENSQASVMMREVRDLYERDRQRTREVVQRLVDALDEMKDAFELYASCQCDGTGCPVCRKLDKADNALFVALAKSQLNIEPTK